MPWIALLDWLQANWLGFLTLLVVGFGAVTSWRLLRRSKRDVTPRVYFAPGDGGFRAKIDVRQEGVEASPFTVHLLVVNLGGSKLKNGKLTLTLPGGLEAVESPGWEEDTPNALVRGGSAVACSLPKIGRNERKRVAPLTVHDSGLRREAGSHSISYRVRWEVWSGNEGLGSNDLTIRFTIDPPPG